MTAKRARQILGGDPALINTKETKPVSIAIDEINRGLIDHDVPQDEQ